MVQIEFAIFYLNFVYIPLAHFVTLTRVKIIHCSNTHRQPAGYDFSRGRNLKISTTYFSGRLP